MPKPKHRRETIIGHRTQWPLELLLKCRNDYIHGKGSLTVISRENKIPQDTLSAYSAKEDWPARRKLFQIQQEQAAQAATLDAIRYPDGKQLPKSVAGRQIERCNTALECCTDPQEAQAWMRVLESAQRLVFLETHGHYPANAKAPQEAPQAPRPALEPGTVKAKPIPDLPRVTVPCLVESDDGGT